MRISIISLACVVLLLGGVAAYAQSTAPIAPKAVASPYSDFFQLAHPSEFSTTLFTGGFRSDKYATIDEGFQFEQRVTNYVGLVGRVTGYQLFIGEGFDDPLDPGNGHRARYNFIRMEAGLDFSPYPLTHFFFFGGTDLGDSSAGIIEGDFSAWMRAYSKHPINAAFSASYDSQNRVTNSEIDLRVVGYSNESYLLLIGGSGSVYGGGFVSGLEGQGGPGFGAYYTPWQLGIDLQSGYGSSGVFGQISMYKSLSWRD